jgi:hypothetical protein
MAGIAGHTRKGKRMELNEQAVEWLESERNIEWMTLFDYEFIDLCGSATLYGVLDKDLTQYDYPDIKFKWLYG